MKNLLEASTTNFQKLIGNGNVYKIPRFQRDYSWTEENWEDLWEDLIVIETNNKTHYMGSIVLQNTEIENTYVVVDWQQRLTTLIICIVGIIKVLQDLIDNNVEPEKNRERIESIKRKYIGEKTLSWLHYVSKLTLNKNNNSFFQDRILTLKEPVNYSKLIDSDKLLYDAYRFFYKQLKEKFKKDDGANLGSFLADMLGSKLMFIEIIVDNELDAYTVFETLNARWVDLTTTDLLKNYLFAIVGDSSEGLILEEKWKSIVDSIWLKMFPTFLRYYLNSKQDLVRKEQLFRKMKNFANDGETVFNLIDELERKSNLYLAIKNPYDEFWNNHSKKNEIVNSLEELKLFGTTQAIPLLFTVYNKLPDLFHKILKIIVVITFRYNVVGKKNPNEMERVYNEIAKNIFSGKIKTEMEIFNLMKKIYINDEDFKNIFATKKISTKGQTKKIVKYIFTKIENHLSSTNYDQQDTNINIEHILPENFWGDWIEKFDQNGEKFVYRLGNYSLLESKINRNCSDKSFNEKIEFYKNSKIKLIKDEIMNFEEWNINNLSSYQKYLAKQASAIWKINL